MGQCKGFDVDDFLEEQATVLNMTAISYDLPIYKTQMNDSFLWLGFQLFHYLSHCPDETAGNSKTFKYYIDVFNQDSPGTIIEAAIDMKNIDASKKTNKQIWKISSSEKLIEKLDTVLTLEYEKSNVLMPVKSEQASRLSAIINGQLRNLLQNCHDKGECQGLHELVEHLGNCYKN